MKTRVKLSITEVFVKLNQEMTKKGYAIKYSDPKTGLLSGEKIKKGSLQLLDFIVEQTLSSAAVVVISSNVSDNDGTIVSNPAEERLFMDCLSDLQPRSNPGNDFRLTPDDYLHSLAV